MSKLVEPNVRLFQSTQEVLRTDSLASIAASTALHAFGQPEQHIVSAFRSGRTFDVVAVLMEEAATVRIALGNAFSVRSEVHRDTIGATLQLEGITCRLICEKYQGAKSEFWCHRSVSLPLSPTSIRAFSWSYSCLGQKREKTNEIRAKSSQVGGNSEVSFASYKAASRAVFRELSVHSGCATLGEPFGKTEAV